MPKTPQTKRRGILSFTKEQELKIYRERYIKQGKIKLAKMYHDGFGETISSWQFQKVIEKYELYYDKIKARRIKIKIVLYLPWGKRYILTALDCFNRLGFARSYTCKSSLSAFDFLLRLNVVTDGKIAAVLSDNGSEFAKFFFKRPHQALAYQSPMVVYYKHSGCVRDVPFLYNFLLTKLFFSI